ncbi:MAG TPA: sulfite exporter TauE/SafE family protein, partial [Chloroflexota bacterium]|nr:sulfite exporter TauE/SafE family protein [Chloroflexota bacterium]
MKPRVLHEIAALPRVGPGPHPLPGVFLWQHILGVLLACALGVAPALVAAALRGGAVAAAPQAFVQLGASSGPLATLFAAGAVGGLMSGLVGVGGAVILLPLLTALTGMSIKEASNITIVQVVAAGLVGAGTYYRRRLIHMRLAALMGGASLAGGLIGGLLSGAVPPVLVEALFLAVVFVAIALLFTPLGETVAADAALPYVDPLLASGLGLGVGGLAGVLGAGGGFLIVPLLIGALRLPTRLAIGTSPAVILLGSAAALAGKAAARQIAVLPALALVAGAVPFTYVGARLSSRLSPRALRLLLGFVLAGIALR